MPTSRSSHRRLAIAIGLTVVAAVPRFYELGKLSFYSDEALSVLSARSVLDHGAPQMPSGMPYLRALPFTWANAGAAALFGVDDPAAYRATSALLGTLTPAAVFLTGTAFTSLPAAAVGATLLALSEWHIAFSRLARMYVPFLFFFLLSGFFFWRWAYQGRLVYLLSALSFFAVTMSLHLLGIFAVQFALVPVFLEKRPAIRRTYLLGTGLVAAAVAFYLDGAVVAAPYEEWSLPAGFVLEGLSPRVPAEPVTGSSPWMLLWAPFGAIVGAWLAWRVGPSRALGDPHQRLIFVGLIGAGALSGVLLALGHLWGATLAGVVLLLICPNPLPAALRRAGLPVLLFSIGAGAWCLYATTSLGLSAGLRRLAMFPFPYPMFFWRQFPGLVALFVGAVLWMLLRHDRSDRHGETTLILVVLMTTAAIGAQQAWGGTRYLFHIYPYLILGASAMLLELCRRGARLVRVDRRWAPVAAMALAISGVTGAHGLAAALEVATLDHGEQVNAHTHIFPFRPDHRGAGTFVRENLRAGDVVIAEQPAIQLIYAGQVDYWFRRAGDARRFMYLAPDGDPRDIYGGARLLSTPDQIENVVESGQGSVWFITSGETSTQRDWYFSDDQNRWIELLEATAEPMYTGEDGLTRVYCLNCAERSQGTSGVLTGTSS